MEMEWSESRYEQREKKDSHDDSPGRSKDRTKSSRGEERDYRSKERERSKRGSDDAKERRKDDRDDKDRSRDNKAREKDRVRDKDRGKEKSKDRDKEREKERDRAREKEKVRDREREREKHRDKETGKERIKVKEREAYQDKEKSRDRVSSRNDEDYDLSKDGRKDDKTKLDDDNKKDRDVKQGEVLQNSENEQAADDAENKVRSTSLELEQRISRMKEERSKKKTEDESDISSWIKQLRKVEAKKNAAKQKALQMSKLLEEQDNIARDESDDEETTHNHNLAGVKVLHGIDKVMEGGAVVLTLKDQNILADGDVNEDIDMLENVEIGEQKRRDEAYKAAKKKPGTYDDKFNDDPFSEKKMLPQYDDPITDEGITLDERGRIAEEAEKKLAELRRRLGGSSSNTRSMEDLSMPGTISSDYYTPEEMLQFKKPKKKKSLRKKPKLDIDALEADAIASGLGVGDLGSRRDAKRQVMKEVQDKAEAERRDHAYQVAYAKADEASKSLRLEQTLPVKTEEEEDVVFADDDEDLYKSLERARKLALKKKEEAPSGPEAVILLASASAKTENEQPPATGESTGKVVFSEMEEFVESLKLGEETQEINNKDFFMEEDEEPIAPKEETKDEPGGWTEVKDTEMDENPSKEEEEPIVPDAIIHEVSIGKGLSGALRLLQDRGTLKETIDWGGRNMDKKKSKLVGIVGDDEPNETQNRQRKNESRASSSRDPYPTKVYHEKDIRIERTDEFGRIMTPKEAFRHLSHKFHGKGPGKMKQEKKLKQQQDELKLKQMESSDTPSLSVARMREAQAQLKTPYLNLSGLVKTGQTNESRSGFANVEKDLPGGLTPMLGDRKVEHFLGIKRKPRPSNLGPAKKPKP